MFFLFLRTPYWIVPLVVGLLITYGITKAVGRHHLMILKQEAQSRLVHSLRHDNSIRVRRYAAVCLGVAGDKQSLEILANEFRQVELRDEIARFISQADDSIDSMDMISELQNVYSDASLRNVDLQNRAVLLVGDCVHTLRRIKRWLKEGNITSKEMKAVDGIGLLENIDSGIDNLHVIARAFSERAGLSYDFVMVITDLDRLLHDFDKRWPTTQSWLGREGTVISDLQNLAERVSVCYGGLSEGYKKQKEEIEKYKNIVRSLVNMGCEGAVKEYRKLATDESVAHSVRCQAIESLGIIGRDEDLRLLIKLSGHEDPEMRYTALISIAMLLSGQRDVGQYWVSGEQK